MKSSYSDNYRFRIEFIPPVYKNKKQKPVIVLAHKDSAKDAALYAKDAQERFAKIPGRVRVINASNVPTVGRCGHVVKSAEAA